MALSAVLSYTEEVCQHPCLTGSHLYHPRSPLQPPTNCLYPAGEICFLILQVAGHPHPPATSPFQTAACPQAAPSRQTQFAGIPSARGPAAQGGKDRRCL